MRIPDRLWILMAKKTAGEASKEELEELGELLAAHGSTGYTNEILEKIWKAKMKRIPEPQLKEEVWDRINAITAGGAAIKPLFTFRRTLVAASLIVLLSVSGILAYQFIHQGKELQPLAIKEQQVSTEPGSKSRLVLPDGTQVWLNGNSEISYSNAEFGKENREIRLTGEAFFDVVKNEKIPFVIHAGPVNITVKGTAFNVKAYPKEKSVETSLVRGLVEVSTAEAPERKILLKPNEKIIIPVEKPVEDTRLIPDTTAKESNSLFTIEKLRQAGDGPAEIAWMKPQLIFDNEPFEQLAPKMESWFNIRIHFRDQQVRQKRFSGVIEKESLKETLEAMQLSGKFTYEIKGSELWIADN